MMMMMMMMMMMASSIHELRAVLSMLDYLIHRVLITMWAVLERTIFCSSSCYAYVAWNLVNVVFQAQEHQGSLEQLLLLLLLLLVSV